jgi:hypothetical protein
VPLALLSTPVVAVHLLALSVWVGSFVTIAVVSRVSARVLDARGRVALFASVGRTYATVGPTALVVALITGVITAGAPARWSGATTVAVVVTLALVLISVAGMLQAHRMTGLRRALASDPTAPGAAAAVSRGASVAMVLRAAIGLFTLVAIVFEAAAVVQH